MVVGKRVKKPRRGQGIRSEKRSDRGDANRNNECDCRRSSPQAKRNITNLCLHTSIRNIYSDRDMRTRLPGCLNTFGIEEMHHTHVPGASHVITGMLFTAPNERGKKENKVGGEWSTAKASRGYELELPRFINSHI